MGGEGPTRTKNFEKCTSFFEIFEFERPLLRYLLKTVLHCKDSGIWLDAITQVCQCFRNLPQFAAVSESERMHALLSRRLVQKSRLKM